MELERITFRCIHCGSPLKDKSSSGPFLECDSRKILWLRLKHPPYMVSKHFVLRKIEADGKG